MQDTHVRSLGPENPLEKGMLAHFSILAWRIPCTEEESSGVHEVAVHGVAKSWTFSLFTSEAYLNKLWMELVPSNE